MYLVANQRFEKIQSPNVIYILADDLGYGDLGCYNKKSKIFTPILITCIRGMMFTDMHSTSSVCTQLVLVFLLVTTPGVLNEVRGFWMGLNDPR